ncbi:MAG: hypothetical protein GX638_14635, partial [Crenarchaeota archaeon]|nr:hypothetical protein [Thermoproteota archaeon]
MESYTEETSIVEETLPVEDALAKAEICIEKINVVEGFVRHDIRNKLSIINCSLFLAKKYLCPNTPLQTQFDQICSAVRNIVHILDFAQAYETAGNKGLFWIPINKSIEDAINLCNIVKDLEINITN